MADAIIYFIFYYVPSVVVGAIVNYAFFWIPLIATVGIVYLVGRYVFRADPRKASLVALWIVIGAVVAVSLGTCVAELYTGRNIW